MNRLAPVAGIAFLAGALASRALWPAAGGSGDDLRAASAEARPAPGEGSDHGGSARFGRPSQAWGSADELNWLYVDGIDPLSGETVTEVWFQFVDGFVTQLGVKQP